MKEDVARFWTTLATCAAALAAMWAAWAATRQLKRLADAGTIQSVQMILQMDDMINRAKKDMADAADVAAKVFGPQGSVNPASDDERKLAKLRLNVAIEDYLNALDRLCACFVKRSLSEKQYRDDYETMIKQAVDKNPKCFNETMPRFRNVSIMYKKWQTPQEQGCLSGLILHVLIFLLPFFD